MMLICEHPGQIRFEWFTDKECEGEVVETQHVTMGACNFWHDPEQSFWLSASWTGVCEPQIDCNQCVMDFLDASLCYCLDDHFDCDDGFLPSSCDESCEYDARTACGVPVNSMEDDCVDVTHINDNPGFYTCDCVSPSDPCLADGECVHEHMCPEASGQLIVSGTESFSTEAPTMSGAFSSTEFSTTPNVFSSSPTSTNWNAFSSTEFFTTPNVFSSGATSTSWNAFSSSETSTSWNVFSTSQALSSWNEFSSSQMPMHMGWGAFSSTEFAVSESSDMCAELEAKYPACDDSYEGDMPCEPSAADMAYYKMHCEEEASVDCHQCVTDFLDASLCYCFDDNFDCDDNLLPSSCEESCEYDARFACGIPVDSMGEDCMDVNHINDNPGFYTCDCVAPSDPCLADGECVPEAMCPGTDGQLIFSAAATFSTDTPTEPELFENKRHAILKSFPDASNRKEKAVGSSQMEENNEKHEVENEISPSEADLEKLEGEDGSVSNHVEDETASLHPPIARISPMSWKKLIHNHIDAVNIGITVAITFFVCVFLCYCRNKDEHEYSRALLFSDEEV